MALVRKETNRLLDMVLGGELDPMIALQMCLDFMSEAEVAEMMDTNDLMADDAEAEEFDDPEDYLFHVYQSQGLWEEASPIMTLVTICPEAYFRETGAQWDQHIPLGLSEDMDELQEGLFEYAGDVDEARKELLAMGLREDPEYSELIQRQIPNDED